MVKTYRDIQLIEKDELNYLAIACDVSASIGEKEGDIVKVPFGVAGYFAAAVPLIELLCIGARPISIIDTLGVEMKDSGQAVIIGIKKAMDEAKVSDVCLTGSTEDNIPTSTTCIGVTIVSELKKNLLKTHMPLKGQHVYLVGLPKMGRQLVEEEIEDKMGEIIDIDLVMKLRNYRGIGHMLPVGSKGIGYELKTLIHMNELKMMQKETIGIDYDVSAGPATCMLVSCFKKDEMFLKLTANCPVTQLGILM